MKNGITVRVLVPRGNLNEDTNGSRTGYTIFQEDRHQVIYEVPEEEAEEFVRRSRGLIDLSE